jgi:hypothetical protein
VTLVADEIIPLAEIETCQDPFVKIRLRAKTGELPFKALCRELKGHPGTCPVLVEYFDEGSMAVVRLKDIRVKPEESLSERLVDLSGGAVEVIL